MIKIVELVSPFLWFEVLSANYPGKKQGIHFKDILVDFSLASKDTLLYSIVIFDVFLSFNYTLFFNLINKKTTTKDGVWGAFGGWSYVAGSSCSATCGTGGQQLQQSVRTCIGPFNGGLNCVGSSVQFRNTTCQQTLPACGGIFFNIIIQSLMLSYNNGMFSLPFEKFPP